MKIDVKKINLDLENKGFSGPHPYFKIKELELINKTIYLKTKKYFKNKIKLDNQLKNIDHKLLDKDFIEYLSPFVRPKVFEFGKSKKILNLISKILNTKKPEICTNFFKFRANYCAPDLVKNSGGKVGWHQDAQTLFLYGFKSFYYDNVTMWVSLNGANKNNSLELVPFSNKKLKLYRQHYKSYRELNEISNDLENMKTFKFDCEPGSIVLFNSLMFHRTVLNTSGKIRFSLDLRFYNPEKKKTDYKINTLLYYDKYLYEFKKTKVFDKISSVINFLSLKLKKQNSDNKEI